MDKKEELISSEFYKDEEVKLPATNSLTKQKIGKLFRMFCIHVIEYEAGTRSTSDIDCDACILRDIPWVQNVSVRNEGKVEHRTKDLCYAIWQEGVLKNA